MRSNLERTEAILALALCSLGFACTGEPLGEGGGEAGVGARAGSAPLAGASGLSSGGTSAAGSSGGANAGAGNGGAGNAGTSSAGASTRGGSGGSGTSGGSGNLGGVSGSTNVGGMGGSDSGGGAGAGGSSGEGSDPLPAFRLVVLGSSSAAGEGASSASRGWVSLLSSSLDGVVATEWHSNNLAQGGYTTNELLPGSGANGNIDDALELEPNLVIVALAGSNDLSAGTSESTFLSRMATLRDTARAAGVPVFFLSTAPKDLSTSERQALRDWAEEMATRFSTCWTPGHDDYSPCFVDIFEPLANDSLGIEAAYSAGDGIHLNDAGHQVIFEAAREVVTSYVCSMTTCR